jgi:hypothetical protein
MILNILIDTSVILIVVWLAFWEPSISKGYDE